MGTPDFAVGTLKELIDNQYDVVAVVTQPDKPKGRSKELVFSPVKEEAVKNNIQCNYTHRYFRKENVFHNYLISFILIPCFILHFLQRYTLNLYHLIE